LLRLKIRLKQTGEIVRRENDFRRRRWRLADVEPAIKLRATARLAATRPLRRTSHPRTTDCSFYFFVLADPDRELR
jgi:hypothetical protein